MKVFPFWKEKRFQPAQFLAVSFASVILLGALLLLLPFSTRTGHISGIDALFTSTSAVCVTGLIVQDTPEFFSTAGQVIILLLFQLGGLGIMTFSTLVLLAARKKISIQDRIIIQQGYHHSAPRNVKTLIGKIFLYTFFFETAGTLSFFLRWYREFGVVKGLYYAAFHSISAFCNAGFSLFSDSFIRYKGDVWINLTLIFLIVIGGLGFLVILESEESFRFRINKKRRKISLHTRLVLTVTGLLICLSFVVFLLTEWDNSLSGLSSKEKIFGSLFQVVTPRTAGFNTLNLNMLGFASVFLLLMLMFVGASPGSTGGGIKTSTIGVIFAFLKSKIAARESVNLFYRTLPSDLITKAFTVFMLGISAISFSAFFLLMLQPEATFHEVLFETFSAFGTVGLSLGLTPRLCVPAKAIIILLMYIGRIGPLTLLYAFSRRKSFGAYEYVEESVMIG
ncbi:MAG: hypothetical protein JXB26_10045 [Candidatus Aminicenantes bacterium]|nr:hypothetical protein [Candidatus Aminicenantes bacterium]